MSGLTTDELVRACQIFLQAAYPSGLENVSPAKCCYLELPAGCDVTKHHAEHPLPESSFALVKNASDEIEAISIRLGCEHFPHLKLKALPRDHRGNNVWVFAVDTHDSFSKSTFRPPPEHPDFQPWITLQEKNKSLKVRIEKEWENAGLLTFNALLRRDLELGQEST